VPFGTFRVSNPGAAPAGQGRQRLRVSPSPAAVGAAALVGGRSLQATAVVVNNGPSYRQGARA
jgi:hypothetical protein